MAEPTCGCEAAIPSCDTRYPTKQPCYRPRSLSFAEKFLKKLDRAGDRIEADVNRSQPSCGCEPAQPTCGCEAPMPMGMPSCGCGPSIPFSVPSSVPTVRNVAPPVPYSPMPTIPAPSQGNRSVTPLDVAPPVKRTVPNDPMFPNKAIDSQARGKISDQSNTVAPKQRPVNAPSPTPTNEAGKVLRPTPVDTPVDTVKREPPKESTGSLPPSTHAEPAPKQTYREPFQQKQVDAPKLPEPIGLPPSSSSQPSQRVPLPKPSPADANDLPQSQEEIPDVLVDPFKDDARWKSQRDRMNGIRLSSGQAKNASRGELKLGREPAVKEQAIPRLELAPPDASVHETGDILVLPPTNDQQGMVIQSAFLKPQPVKVKANVLRMPVETESDFPYVKRTAVPRPK
jgi:hypothetical protein